MGTVFSSAGGDNALAFDGDIETKYTTSTDNCEIGYSFPAGHSSTLTRVRWYMGSMDKKYDYFVGFTKF